MKNAIQLNADRYVICNIQNQITFVSIQSSFQSEEEKKLQVNELRRILVNRKEKYMKIEAAVTKLEGEVEDTNKRIQNVQARLEQAVAALKQV